MRRGVTYDERGAVTDVVIGGQEQSARGWRDGLLGPVLCPPSIPHPFPSTRTSSLSACAFDLLAASPHPHTQGSNTAHPPPSTPPSTRGASPAPSQRSTASSLHDPAVAPALPSLHLHLPSSPLPQPTGSLLQKRESLRQRHRIWRVYTVSTLHVMPSIALTAVCSTQLLEDKSDGVDE